MKPRNANGTSLNTIEELWDIPTLPFLYKPLESPHNPDPVPDFFPFRLGVESSTGRLLQEGTPLLDATLEQAYIDGSMVTGQMDDVGIGRDYAEDFLSVIDGVIGPGGVDGLRVLEIGCGNGYLLHRLQRLGADVKGIDPGPHAEQACSQYGLEIDRGFFPAVDVGADYDVVILYMVIEHVQDPAVLVQEVNRVVKPGGVVILAVQDEEPYISGGELSLLFHEHFSYFTSESLTATIVHACGVEPLIIRSKLSNLLHAVYSPGSASASELKPPNLTPARDFRAIAEKTMTALKTVIDDRLRGGRPIGFFVPARAVNLLTLIHGPFEGLRFFDDNQMLHGSFYPGFDCRVESRAELLRDPPSTVFIMSLSFGRTIMESVSAELSADVELIDLASVISGDHRTIAPPC